MTIAVSAVFGVVFALASLGVLYGRFRKVTVPKPRYWSTPRPLVACDPSLAAPTAEAITRLRAIGLPIDWAGSPSMATITVRADASLDDRASVDDGAPSLHGITHSRTDADGWTFGADVRVLPWASAVVIAHELCHALGYEHPNPWPPSGHLLHPTRPGWDARGIAS